MNVLVIGAGLVPELLKRGHRVALLSREADRDTRKYGKASRQPRRM